MTRTKPSKATITLAALTIFTVGMILAALFLPTPWDQICTLVLIAWNAIGDLLERHWFKLACWALLAAGIAAGILLPASNLPALVQLLGILGILLNMSYWLGVKVGASRKNARVGVDRLFPLAVLGAPQVIERAEVREALRRAGVARG